MNTTKPEATILKAGGFIVILCSLLRVSQLITQISLTFANVSTVDMTDKEIEIKDIYLEGQIRCGGIFLSAVFLAAVGFWIVRQPPVLRRLLATRVNTE